MIWYFAYGSNMQSATLRGRRGIQARRAVAGELCGWRLVVDKPPLVSIGQSFANIVPAPDARVFGALYELSRSDYEHLELTEGVRIGNYEAVSVRVVSLRDGASYDARTLTSPARDPKLRPSTRYMSLLIEGAIEHGLPPHYVESLRRIPALPEPAEVEVLRGFIDEALKKRDP